MEFTTSRSCSGGGCVEVGHDTDGSVHIRSSRTPAVVLTFTGEEWDDFLVGAKLDEFDRPDNG
jgi:hypothetical protein